MKHENGSEGGQQNLEGDLQVTRLAVLVVRPDGSSQVVHYERQEALPLVFQLNGCVRKNSKEFPDTPGRLKFFFSKEEKSPKAKTDAKSEEGGSDD